jgi:acyl-CoA reductase-like NAD-dependent aldehyde dehydrogenase
VSSCKFSRHASASRSDRNGVLPRTYRVGTPNSQTIVIPVINTRPFCVANEPQTPNADLAVTNKFTGTVVAHVAVADAAAIDAGIAAAVQASEPMAR